MKYSWITMLCESLLYSKVTHLFTYIYILFLILFHYGLSQDIENSSLHYTVGPCCLSILYIVVCICWSQTPNPSLPHPQLPLILLSWEGPRIPLQPLSPKCSESEAQAWALGHLLALLKMISWGTHALGHKRGYAGRSSWNFIQDNISHRYLPQILALAAPWWLQMVPTEALEPEGQKTTQFPGGPLCSSLQDVSEEQVQVCVNELTWKAQFTQSWVESTTCTQPGRESD